MTTTRIVRGHRNDYVVATPNKLCRYRADDFFGKEPETIEWINGFNEGAVFWDVGANVGLYSIYAARERNAHVWAIEPSVFNLECLARNIYLNDVSELVCILPIALSDKTGASLLRMSSTEWGGALSTFDKEYGFDGKNWQRFSDFKPLVC